MWPNPQLPVDLYTFTEEVFNGKLHFLCSGYCMVWSNYMKLNEDKSHLLVAVHKHENVWTNVDCSESWESQSKKLLGLVMARNLNLNDHV